jgi:hypothetical protein
MYSIFFCSVLIELHTLEYIIVSDLARCRCYFNFNVRHEFSFYFTLYILLIYIIDSITLHQ